MPQGAIALGAAVCAAFIVAAGPPVARGFAQSPPQFRSGTDLTRVDVAVLDVRTRKPIHGLTPDDFVLSVGGKERPVVAAAESTFGAAPRSVSAGGVITNRPIRGRLFIIVMDDIFGNGGPFYLANGRRVGHAIIDGLGKDDLAAVIFAQSQQNSVGFTDDRDALHRAVETYTPRPLLARLSIDISRKVLLGARQFLGTLPEYRRAIAWITYGPTLARDSLNRTIGGVPVYVFRTLGLEAPTDGRPVLDPAADSLRTFTQDTGGRVFLDTNDPALKVPGMFDEMSSFYTLGFDGPDVKPAAWTTVSVRRPGAEVVPSSFAYQSPESRVTTDAGAVNASRRKPIGLFEALSGPVPVGDLPLRLTTVPISTGAAESALLLTLGFAPPPQAAAGDAYRLDLLVFDGDGSKERYRQASTIRTAVVRESEILLKVPLPAGRYSLRLAVEHEPTKLVGSVYAQSLVVPEFRDAPLSLSGIVVGHAEGGSIGGRQAVTDLLPFPPTAVRTFSGADHVSTFVRVHQQTGRTPVDASIEVSLVDQDDAVVASTRDTLAAAAFSSGKADYKFDIPLSNLKPGTFRLRLIVRAGARTEERTLLFVVQ